MKKNKGFFGILALIICAAILLGACSASKQDLAGKYYAYDGDDKVKDTLYDLKSDNTWESTVEGATDLSGTYTLDGENITLTISSSSQTVTGTLSADGVLVLTVSGTQTTYKKDPPLSFGEMTLAALFVFLIVFALLGVLYVLIKLSTGAIQLLETKINNTKPIQK